MLFSNNGYRALLWVNWYPLAVQSHNGCHWPKPIKKLESSLKEADRAILTVSGQLMQLILACNLNKCMRKKMRKTPRNHIATTSKNWKAAQLGHPCAHWTHNTTVKSATWKKNELCHFMFVQLDHWGCTKMVQGQRGTFKDHKQVF